MIEPLIELVAHPVELGLVAQQAVRLPFEIGEAQRMAGAQRLVELRDHARAERRGGDRALPGLAREAPLAHLFERRAERVVERHQPSEHGIGNRLGRAQAAAALGGQQIRGLAASLGRIGREHGLGEQSRVQRAEAAELDQQVLQQAQILDEGRRIEGGFRRLRIVRVDAERIGKLSRHRRDRVLVTCRAVGDQRPPVAAALDEAVQPAADRRLARIERDQRRQRLRLAALRRAEQFGEHGVERLGDELALAFDEREACRHLGLDREACQQVLAERVQRLCAQAEWRVQQCFVQAARALAQRRLRHEIELAQPCVEHGLIGEGELAQARVDALAHLRRGLAREGQREDAAGRGPGEQQANDARHQLPGLAAAGRGGDADRLRGIEREIHAGTRAPRRQTPR